MIRNLIQLFFLGIVLVGVVCPILAVSLGVEQDIYSDFRGFGPVFSLLVASSVVFVGFLALTPTTPPRKHLTVAETNNFQVFLSFSIIIFWTAIFILAGGLSYRVDDVFVGTEGRSSLLIIAQSATNIIIILSVATLSKVRMRTPLKIVSWIISLSFIGAVAASGSRGVVLTWLIALFFARTMRKAVVPGTEMSPSSVVTPPSFFRAALKPRAILLSIITLAGFGLWGALRDQYYNVGYSLLWRLSEPYWYMAATANEDVGNRPYILSEALWRIVTIPARWFGYSPDFSIEGQEYILENYLGIQRVEGVSLPMPLMGEGFLFYGTFGAAAFILLGGLLIIFAYKVIERMTFASREIYWAFLGVFVAKVAFSYARSLSGIFLITWYEPLRDFIILTLLFFFFRSRADGGKKGGAAL